VTWDRTESGTGGAIASPVPPVSPCARYRIPACRAGLFRRAGLRDGLEGDGYRMAGGEARRIHRHLLVGQAVRAAEADVVARQDHLPAITGGRSGQCILGQGDVKRVFEVDHQQQIILTRG
jgi:hypothetical protein